MKILVVNYTDAFGGAARAAYRLHKSLLNANVSSRMLVLDKKTDDYTILGPQTNLQKIWSVVTPRLENFLLKLRYKNKSPALFSPANISSKSIVKRINAINADIVHLNWVNFGMLKIEDVARIKAPIVWSLHDNWVFTGGCHYAEECLSYQKSCGSCKALNSYKENDLSRKIWLRKQKMLNSKENVNIIGVSSWIIECSKNSSLLKNKKHVNLPNPIDTDVFRRFDKEKSKQLWNFSKDKKLILFGGINIIDDPRKGFRYLSNAIKRFAKNDNIEFVVFGSSKPQYSYDFNLKIHYLGHLHDDTSLVTLYSAVEVLVVPSLQENLSNTIMESLSCCLPVVAFDIGGNSDMVDHKKNGYLAKPFDSNDLKRGIDWVLGNENYNELCKNARQKILDKFDSKIVAKRYIELYKEILAKCNIFKNVFNFVIKKILIL